MKYQLIVSTMGQKDDSIYYKMNIGSDAIIINQSDFYEIKETQKDGNTIKMYTFNERGIGLSRNSGMMRSDADIIQFADDDMIFTNTYKEDVIKEFENHPEADIILFSLQSLNPKRPLIRIDKFSKVSKKEALKYGCARVAARREKLIYNNINFSLLFGGGARFGSGEDTIFLQDCLNAGLKIYKSPVKIADVKQEESSWFDGYNQKYYEDKGALFRASLPCLCYVYAIVSAIKSSSKNYKRKEVFRFYLNGIKLFKRKQRGVKK